MGGNQPLVPKVLPADLEAVPVNNPPFSHFGRIAAIAALVLASQPPPPSPFMGGQQPLAPRVLCASITDVPVNDPPFSHSGRTVNYDVITRSWQVVPPLPTLNAKVIPQSVAQPDNPPFSGRDSLSGILRTWQPPPPQPVQQAVTDIVSVDNPPFSSRSYLPGILSSWIPPAPQPVQQAKTQILSVDEPPYSSRNHVTGILSAWQPPPPAPWQKPNTQIVSVDNPPFGLELFDDGITIQASWCGPVPPLPTLNVKLVQDGTVASADNPPFGKYRDISPLYTGWLSPVPLPAVSAKLVQDGTVISSDNPPFGARPWLPGVIGVWQPPQAWPVVPRPMVPAGGCAVVSSVPATFTINDSLQTVTFAIPAGVYTSATWESVGVWSGPALSNPLTVTTAGHVVTLATRSANGTFDDSVAASAPQLADINAAAGGNLSADLTIAIKQDVVSSFTLTICAAPVDNPPFGWRPWVHPVIRTWEPPAASWHASYQRPGLVVGVPVDNPPLGAGNAGTIETLRLWDTPPPLPWHPYYCPPRQTVSVDNPPFGSTGRLNSLVDVQVAWQPAPPQPVQKPNTQILSVDNPPFSSRNSLPGILSAWIPPAPAPFQQARTQIVSVDNPPGNTNPWLSGVVQSWQPVPPLPAMGAKLVTGVPVNEPPYGSMPWLSEVVQSWQVVPPLPTLTAKLVQPGVVSADNPPGSNVAVLAAILGSWQVPAPSAITARLSPPSITAVPVNDPPFSSRNNLSGIIATWQPGAPQPIQKPAGQIVSVDNPPFGLELFDDGITVQAAWWNQAVPPLPTLGQKLVQPGAAPADNPPIGWPDTVTNLTDVVGAWQTVPPLPTLNAKLVQDGRADNPPFATGARSVPEFTDTLITWLSTPPLPTLTAKLVQGIDNPPFGSRPWLSGVVQSWQIPVPLPTLTAKLPQGAPPDNPPFGQKPWRVDVVQLWQPGPPQPWQKPKTQIVSVDAPPIGLPDTLANLQDALYSWIPGSPLPTPSRKIVIGVPVNDPPFGIRPWLPTAILSWQPGPPMPWRPRWQVQPAIYGTSLIITTEGGFGDGVTLSGAGDGVVLSGGILIKDTEGGGIA